MLDSFYVPSCTLQVTGLKTEENELQVISYKAVAGCELRNKTRYKIRVAGYGYKIIYGIME
jgi:hypothetical protein